MSQSPANLAWVRTFEAAVRHSSLSKAAAELGLSQAAVSLHMRALEAECGCKLLYRNRRGVSLTPQGADYLAMVKGPLLSISSSTQSMVKGSHQETISICMPPGLAQFWLIPITKKFNEAFPDLLINLRSDYRSVSPDEDEVDIVINFGEGGGSQGEAHCLFMERLTPVCSPGIAIEDWPTLPLIKIMDDPLSWRAWFNVMGIQSAPSRYLTVDNFPHAYAAAILGVGVMLAPPMLITEALERGELVRLSSSELLTQAGYFLIPPRGKPMTQKQNQVAQWLIKQASESQV